MNNTFPDDYDDFNNELARAEVEAYERDRAAGKTVEPPDPSPIPGTVTVDDRP
jgi:hypothetical protein